MKHFIPHCINTTFTLSYDTMSYETFHTMLYQYNIHIIVRYDVVWNISYHILSKQHSHYCMIHVRCRMKHVIPHCINTTFTLLYDTCTMSYETCHTTLYQYNIHICMIHVRCRMKHVIPHCINTTFTFCMIHVRRMKHVIPHCINTTFTLLYDTCTMSYETCHTTLYQYNIHIIVWYMYDVVWNMSYHIVSIQHSHYCMIHVRCRMKTCHTTLYQYNIHILYITMSYEITFYTTLYACINKTFTLLYATILYEMTFHTTLYQYNIHIIVQYEMTFHTFTLSYDKMSYETTFHTKLYQYNIHIVSCKNVSYDNHLHFVQSGHWICTVSVKTGHCALCSHDLNEWRVTSAFCPNGLAQSRPVIQISYGVDVHIGGKG